MGVQSVWTCNPIKNVRTEMLALDITFQGMFCLAFQTKEGCKKRSCQFKHEVIGYAATKALMNYCKQKAAQNKSKPGTPSKKAEGTPAGKKGSPPQKTSALHWALRPSRQRCARTGTVRLPPAHVDTGTSVDSSMTDIRRREADPFRQWDHCLQVVRAAPERSA